jgi:hypothetical protein
MNRAGEKRNLDPLLAVAPVEFFDQFMLQEILIGKFIGLEDYVEVDAGIAEVLIMDMEGRTPPARFE